MGSKPTTEKFQSEDPSLFIFTTSEAKEFCIRIKQILEKEINIKKSEAIVIPTPSQVTSLCKISASVLPIPDRAEQDRLLNVLNSFLQTIDESLTVKPLANKTVFYVHKI